MNHTDNIFELKQLDETGTIEGLASGTGDVDLGGDRILFGAFQKTLSDRGNRPLPMLLHHDLSRPVGAWHEAKETSEGLYLKGRLSMATRDAQEAHALVRDGALTGLSIGWKGKGAIDRSGVRELAEVELFEASLVAVGMHPRATVTAIKSISSADDIREMLREGGLSGRQAKTAAGAAWRSINEEEPIDMDAVRAILKLSIKHIDNLGVMR